jgi:DNA (cytosine-5)-methyltransferase 1
MKPTARFKNASFFAGIGGIDLGFENAGIETVYQCEIDNYCLNILNHHWPNVKKHTDIRKVVENDSFPKADIWSAGFPCQDVSLARARPREGLKGERTGLFYEFAELLSRYYPPVILLENVPGLLNSHQGRDFAIVIQTLANIGYGVGWRVLNSRYFGVPQSRQRVYIVGSYNDPRRAAEILFEPECGSRHLETGGKSREKAISPFMECAEDPCGKGKLKKLNKNESIVPKLAFCLAATSGRHTGTDWSRTYVAYSNKARRLTPEECERLQGFPTGWTIPDGLFKNEDDIDSLRYKALGNAVSVPVAEWIGKRIIFSLTTNPVK